MEIRKKQAQVIEPEEIYVPQQATEEEDFSYLSESDRQLKELHDKLTEAYGDAAPMLSQIEAWKSRWGNIQVSKVGADRKEYYIWRTLLRYEYKEMQKGKAAEDDDAFNEMIVEKCILYPFYDFQFKTKSDAGIISTLGQQISYRSGFVSPQEALSLIYIQ